jgi:hypothetical protein
VNTIRIAALSVSLRARSVNTALLREILSTMAARVVDNTSLVAAIIHSRDEGTTHVAHA